MIAVPRVAATSGATAGRRVAAFAAVLALAALTATPAPAVAAAPPTKPPETGGATHQSAAGADLVSVTLRDRVLGLEVREAAAGRRAAPAPAGVDPSTVVFGPASGTVVRVPDLPAFRFLGTPGRPVWALTAGDTEFASLDTTRVSRDAVRDDVIELSLGRVDGPGHFAAYTIGGLGQPAPLFGTLAGMPRAGELPAGVRTGGLVWLFDAAGEYRLSLTASATLASGDRVSIDATYRVAVPELDTPVQAPSPAPAPRPASETTAGRAASSAAAPNAVAAPAGAGDPTGADRSGAQPLAAATERNSATGSGRVVIDDGHIDMGPQIDGSDWTIRIKDDTVTPAVWRNLADVVLHAKDNARTTVPEGADFLGKPGDPVWLLPQAQRSGIVWPGWNTQHPSVVGGTRGPVTWTFKGASGPGRFTLFLTGSFGAAEVLFDSSAGLPQRLDIPANTHAHGNWAFSQPGIYRLAFEMTGTTTAGARVTDTKTLTFAVGDATDPNAGFGPGGGGDGSGNGGNGNGGNGSGGNGSGSGGKLPRTGGSWHLPAAGLLLVVAGAFVLVSLRGRRTSH
ncbi:TIGR03773 family transporter-associated surface protein [Micromonospora sp. WMMD1082]|uniref:TIGR03773 family transporter-associated surface protein n=1 Tax=Micromonospora sp. WMMD1082 TaxID=3016104 RepID=UPI0024178DCC|nr:TIGR03773 family transporter-associated surface protein [Micromonospora sp. WMMD1082]MDG4793266.1 TIGR03773 family transporter-associated surface protein [Micromonospora sp. WMMD1082]